MGQSMESSKLYSTPTYSRCHGFIWQKVERSHQLSTVVLNLTSAKDNSVDWDKSPWTGCRLFASAVASHWDFVVGACNFLHFDVHRMSRYIMMWWRMTVQFAPLVRSCDGGNQLWRQINLHLFCKRAFRWAQWKMSRALRLLAGEPRKKMLQCLIAAKEIPAPFKACISWEKLLIYGPNTAVITEMGVLSSVLPSMRASNVSSTQSNR